MAKKNCVICGKEGYSYFPFCYEHLQEKNAGKIVKCDDCGTWHYVDKPCGKCGGGYTLAKSPETPIKHTNTTAEDASSALTCIICGQPSDGKHFCKACYHRYKERAVDIRIIHCSETKILDEYGNKTYKCDDGRVVRSRAEAIICSWLYNNKIRVKYEETVYYKDETTGEIKELHPDFYLPDYDLYIEYNELTNSKYIKSKEFTKQIYEKQGKKIIIMTDEELHDVAAFIRPLLIK